MNGFYIDFRQKVLSDVTDFNIQENIVKSAFEASQVANLAYEAAKQRFLIGEVDVTTLSLILKKRDNALSGYLQSLRAYWVYFYNIRELTLFDFENNTPLTEDFDKIPGVE